jgi:hypothetical protein
MHFARILLFVWTPLSVTACTPQVWCHRVIYDRKFRSRFQMQHVIHCKCYHSFKVLKSKIVCQSKKRKSANFYKIHTAQLGPKTGSHSKRKLSQQDGFRKSARLQICGRSEKLTIYCVHTFADLWTAHLCL